MSPAATTRRRQHRRLHPLVIALMAIAVTVFVTFYAFNQGLPFVHKFTLHALVSNSVNVRADSPVRIAGIDVGAVQGVTPEGRASEVTFTMNSNGLPVHTDATLRIRDRLFLEGGYYLELDPGSPGAPIAHDGFTIPEAQTTSPVQFYEVLSTFTQASRTSLRNTLAELNAGFSAAPGQPILTSGAAGLKAAIPQLTPTLKDIAWVSQALHGTHPGDVERLLSSSAGVLGTLAGREAHLTDLIHSLNLTSAALASADGALAQTVAGVDETLQVAPTSLAEIDRALPPVGRLAQTLDPSLKVAPPILTGVTHAVDQLAGIVAPAERAKLLTTLRATFVEFPTIVRELASAFPITKSATDCLRIHIVPVLRSQVPDGPLSSGRPVWQDFVHFLPGVAGASGGFDANGPYTRVLAGAGTQSVSSGPLGSLPLIGQIVGSSPPGGTSLLGARPSWIGDLSGNDFRPDVPCRTQRIPSLGAPAAAADLRSTRTPASKPMSAAALSAAMTGTGSPK